MPYEGYIWLQIDKNGGKSVKSEFLGIVCPLEANKIPIIIISIENKGISDI